ncbi:putative methyltransferase [Chondrocystis sp. NIES-4102]|nr:putative methyltransferase [Chondrocystis sp. NIES-4102]
MSKPEYSLPPDYFEELYQADPDPWKFETSDYEAQKYQKTVNALPKPRYKNAFEIGGSIGVLTATLAQRCDSLLSVDVSPTAQSKAIARCQDLPQVRFKIAQVPQDYPSEIFDLTVMSEVGYYLNWDDFKTTQQLIIEHLTIGGHLILVHWTLPVPTYPLTGDLVHDSFLELDQRQLKHLKGFREDKYRLDVFERI